VALSLLATVPLRTGFHPTAAATSLLVRLGGFQPTWTDATTVPIGVLVVATTGELLRRLGLAQPGQK
jgi:hypothetical protein